LFLNLLKQGSAFRWTTNNTREMFVEGCPRRYFRSGGGYFGSTPSTSNTERSVFDTERSV